MSTDRWDLGLDRIAGAVWFAMLLLGIVAWHSSGTPVAGAAIVAAVPLAVASSTGALYATCAAIPLIFHPIHIGTLTLGLLELGVLITAFGTALRIGYEIAHGSDAELRKALGPLKLQVLPVGLFALGTLSLVWMPFDFHRVEAMRSWRWVIFEPVLLFALARLAIVRHGRAPLALAISAPAAFVALAALWQLIDSSSSFSVDEVRRSTATYLHPNNLALFLERALFLVLIPGLVLRGRARWFLLGLSLIIVAGIGSTFSRGALLGLTAGFVVVLLAHPFRRGWRLLAGGLGLVTVAFGALATDRFTGAGSSGIVSTRRYLWTDAVHMVRDFPISGIGLDQFLWMHQQRYIDPRIWSERYVSHPHNLLFDTWLSLGIAGVAFLCAVVLVGAWVIAMARTGRLNLDPWQLGALACLGAGLGHGLVDNGYFLADLAATTWLAIALAAPERPDSLTTHD
ncbi:MAG TPA: O-antigen ligase family protein [Thermomicrobiales bacterium]|nr:O-antigen ligase family protein [Thermomicrobiales bacterium]